MTGKAQFSFGELLVLLDVEGAGAISAPMPTPEEAAALTATTLRGVAPCVEGHGALRFRADIYEPPRTELVASPGHLSLAITRFHDQDVWTSMFEWLSGYLGDTLEQVIKRDDYLEYAGQGVRATLAFTRPNVRLDSRSLVIDVALRHDEPPLASLRRLLGIAADIAPKDDGNWHELATRWPMHLECSRHAAALRFRFSAPHHDKQTSTAGLCEEWCSRWLGLCAGKPYDRSQLSWDLGEHGRASMVRGDGAHRRDVHELHVPASWL
jgi:hypothetical protein